MMREFRQLEVLNNHQVQPHRRLLQDYRVEVQMFQLKEGLQNNQLKLVLKMAKMIPKEENCLILKTRRMSHQAVVFQSSHKIMDKKTQQKVQRRQVL
jgi:hypothetical protein